MPQESLHAPTERRQPARALRVIVADDDRDTVDTLAKLLEGEGHVVQRVYNGKEVLPAVRIMRPDAVILDVALPLMSGCAVAQPLRESFTDARRPLLVAISACGRTSVTGGSPSRSASSTHCTAARAARRCGAAPCARSRARFRSRRSLHPRRCAWQRCRSRARAR